MSRAQLHAAENIIRVISMTPTEYTTLLYLAERAGEQSLQLCETLDTIAREIGCSKGYLGKTMRRFRELGLMHTQHRYWTDSRGVKHRTTAVHTIHIPTVEMWLEGYRYDGSTRKPVTVKCFGPWEPQAPDIVLLAPITEK